VRVQRETVGRPRYRVLFTSLPYLSHLLAQLPLARAMRDAGHEARFATSAALAGMVRADGFAVVPVEFGEPPEPGLELPLRPRQPGEQPPRPRVRVAARVAPALTRAFEQWLPDVVVRDPLEYGSYLAAEHAGIPHAVGREGPFWPPQTRQAMLGADLDDLRGRLGLPPDPSTQALYRFLAFVFAPPELLSADTYISPVTHFIRPAPADSVSSLGDADWTPPPPGATFVYATLGTVFNRRNPGLLGPLIEALAGERYQALVTAGPGRDLRPLTRFAAAQNLTVLGYVPQSAVLPHCDVIVAHGGFHTVIGALLHGLPLVLLPLGGDHARNARWCSAQGAALVLDEAHRDPESIRAGIRQVLAEPGYRDAAKRLQAAMAGLPGMATAVSLLERLAATRAPIRRDAGQEG
jgi:UDP:flavonoid glycosyltransferase YjiC (YdhE family)